MSTSIIQQKIEQYQQGFIEWAELPEEAQRLLQGNSPYVGLGGEHDNYETMLEHGLPGHEGHYDGGQGFE